MCNDRFAPYHAFVVGAAFLSIETALPLGHEPPPLLFLDFALL